MYMAPSAWHVARAYGNNGLDNSLRNKGNSIFIWEKSRILKSDVCVNHVSEETT